MMMMMMMMMIVTCGSKDQYPVTAHAPNFDFWKGCPKIKRCEESKRTLKNPFASCLAEFDTTLKTSEDYRLMIYCSR